MAEDYVLRQEGDGIVVNFQNETQASLARSVLIMAGLTPEKVGLFSMETNAMFAQLREKELRIENIESAMFEDIYAHGKTAMAELRRQAKELNIELGDVGVRASSSEERILPSIPVVKTDQQRTDVIDITKALRRHGAKISTALKGSDISFDVLALEKDDRLTTLELALEEVKKERGRGGDRAR